MSRKAWIKLVGLAAVIVGLIVGLRMLGLDVTRLTPAQVRTFVLSFGVWAPVIYLAVYGQPLVPLPASIMTATAGLLFGTLWGVPAAMAGTTLRACTQFLVARLVGQEAVEKLLRGHVSKLYQTTGRIGFKTVFLVRFIPNFPFDVQNYALGFSDVRFAPYMLGTILGLIPGTIVVVYFGHALTDARRLWPVLLAMLLIVGLVIVQRLWAAKRRQPPAAP